MGALANTIILEKIISYVLTDTDTQITYGPIPALRRACKRWNQEVDRYLLASLAANPSQLTLTFSTPCCRFRAANVKRMDSALVDVVLHLDLTHHFETIEHILHNDFLHDNLLKDIEVGEKLLGYCGATLEHWDQELDLVGDLLISFFTRMKWWLTPAYLIKAPERNKEGHLIEALRLGSTDLGIPAKFHWTGIHAISRPFLVFMELHNVPAKRVVSWLDPTKRFTVNLSPRGVDPELGCLGA